MSDKRISKEERRKAAQKAFRELNEQVGDADISVGTDWEYDYPSDIREAIKQEYDRNLFEGKSFIFDPKLMKKIKKWEEEVGTIKIL